MAKGMIKKNMTRSFDAAAFSSELKAARDATTPGEEEEAAHRARMTRWTLTLGLVGGLLAARGSYSPAAMLLLGL